MAHALRWFRCERCNERFARHQGRARFCSKSCAARRLRSTKPRSKPCVNCGQPVTRQYPYYAARVQHCSLACQAETTRRRMTEGRYDLVAARFGPLTPRERELWAHGYKLGYQRRRITERRKAERAARAAA
ncbi:MAG TPA: hypothetical protein VFO31_04400 [Vicinamibacterales bacterium]|nr:hypothetical protein [Vicinamibacterales bacterium]